MANHYRLLAGTLVAAIAVLAAGGAAQAKDPKDSGKSDSGKSAAPLPEVFTKVLDCRQISDPAERLACFDAAVTELARAQENKDLRVVTREDVNRTRRSLFGFVGSGFGLFGDGRDGEGREELKEITAVIKSFSGDVGSFVFTLDDGSVWLQSDNSYIRKPQAGKTITIRRAALGSFMASIDGGVWFKIKRRS
jgi:hypothetical protein